MTKTEIARRHDFIRQLLKELEILEDSVKRSKAIWQKYDPDFQSKTSKAKKTL